MSSFSNQPFSERFQRLGDDAEAVFEKVCLGRFQRFGLDRPENIDVWKVPAFVRHAPDYLMNNNLVEVKAVGGDQILKLKLEEWSVLNMWETHMPVALFIWNSTKRLHGWITLQHLNEYIHSASQVVTGRFSDGKLHYRIPLDMMSAAVWEDAP